MAYRTDRKRELRENLERLAEEEAELEKLAQDLETFSQYKSVEVRLRTKGLNLIEQEDAEDAKEYVDTLLRQAQKTAKKRKEKRDYVLGKIKKLAKPVAGITVALGVVAGVGIMAEQWWNANDYAVKALLRYDKPVKIESIKERKEIISQLDEIIEEHTEDIGSDEAAADYLRVLESKGYPISVGAKVLDRLGQSFNSYTASNLKYNAIDYLDFFSKNKLEPSKEGCLFNLAKTQS